MNTAPTLSSSGERIAVVDVLRAYALFGIIITHSVDGFLAGQEPVTDFMLFSPLDHAVKQLAHLFTFGKFYSIFSFLFGLSFAIQLRNAMQKGAGFSGRFAWRLAVLALIALVHGAFFAGDILIIYALLGLLLIPFRNMKTKTLLIVGLILAFNVPGLLLGAAVLAAPISPEQLQGNAETQAQYLEMAKNVFAIKQSGTLAQLVQTNYSMGILGKMAFMVITGRLWITFGLFLLGMCAGRLEIFKDTEANRASFRKLLWPAGVVALVTTLMEWRYPMGQQFRSAMDLLHWFLMQIQHIFTGAVPHAACCLHSPHSARWASPLISARLCLACSCSTGSGSDCWGRSARRRQSVLRSRSSVCRFCWRTSGPNDSNWGRRNGCGDRSHTSSYSRTIVRLRKWREDGFPRRATQQWHARAGSLEVSGEI
jgi:uncharacterized membrane protein YeiB